MKQLSALVVGLAVSLCARGAEGSRVRHRRSRGDWNTDASKPLNGGPSRRGQEFVTNPPEQDVENPNNEPKNCWEPKGGKTCTPSSSPTISFAPSHRPSVLPSSVPTISPQPTISSPPSASPTTSRAPSETPTAFPSPSPSQLPSLFPSPSPTQRPSLFPSPSPTRRPTLFPTRSPQPSATPTMFPTLPPTTAFPTVSLAPTRTKRPTVSPTVDPNGFTTRINTDTTNATGVISSCRPDIPDTATVMDQAVVFYYDLQLLPGADAALAVDYIASQLHRVLSEKYLNCQYEADFSVLAAASDNTTNENATESVDPFHIYAFSSLPVDVLENEVSDCSEATTTDDVDCYRVDGAFLAKVFYLGDGERRLQEVNVDVTDPALLESLTSTLESMFNGNLTSGMSSIVGTSFLGITNDGQAVDDDPGTDDEATDDEAPVVDDASVPEDDTIAPRGTVTDRSSSRNTTPRIIVSSILGVAIAMLLSAALIFFVWRRRRGRGDSKPMDTTQPYGKGENSYFTDLAADPSYERDDRAMLSADRSYIASDDGSYMSGAAGSSRYPNQRSRRNDFKVAVIVEDDQSSFGPSTSGFPALDIREFDTTRRVSHQNPSFVKTDEILDSLRQAEMRSRMKELGPRLVGEGTVSRGQRDYDAPDTVQL